MEKEDAKRWLRAENSCFWLTASVSTNHRWHRWPAQGSDSVATAFVWCRIPDTEADERKDLLWPIVSVHRGSGSVWETDQETEQYLKQGQPVTQDLAPVTYHHQQGLTVDL